MPHTITLSDPTFAMLQALATPFVDTPESVIASLATEAINRRGATSIGMPPTHATGDSAIRLDPDRPENLTHAKVLSASFDGTELHRPKWNSLLDHVHIVARRNLGSFEAVKRISGAHLRQGKYEEEGFHYLSEADLSIQGVGSNFAWAHSLGVARHLRMPIQVRFEWRHKDDAAHPGQTAVLEWSPAPSLSV